MFARSNSFEKGSNFEAKDFWFANTLLCARLNIVLEKSLFIYIFLNQVYLKIDRDGKANVDSVKQFFQLLKTYAICGICFP